MIIQGTGIVKDDVYYREKKKNFPIQNAFALHIKEYKPSLSLLNTASDYILSSEI